MIQLYIIALSSVFSILTSGYIYLSIYLLFTWLRSVKTLASVWCLSLSWPCLSSYNPGLSRIICYGIRKEQMTTVFKTSPCQTNDFEKLENSKKIQNCQFRLTVYGAVPTVFLNLKYNSVHMKICFIRIYSNVLPIVAGSLHISQLIVEQLIPILTPTWLK